VHCHRNFRATAETLSREVEAFFRNLRADPVDGVRRTGT
jgi:methyl-accepting chemotaxis protein